MERVVDWRESWSGGNRRMEGSRGVEGVVEWRGVVECEVPISSRRARAPRLLELVGALSKLT
jgi:hypothetical protein